MTAKVNPFNMIIRNESFLCKCKLGAYYVGFFQKRDVEFENEQKKGNFVKNCFSMKNKYRNKKKSFVKFEFLFSSFEIVQISFHETKASQIIITLV